MSGHPTRQGWFRGPIAQCDPVPPRPDRIFRLILLGPPGVGKGTQAELLADRLRACHLSTGDLFRAAKCQADPSPAMASALEAMRRGELVSDELVMELVRERKRCLRCHGGFILDGVPRTITQAEALDELLDELNVGLDAVLSYELPLEEIVDRIGGRRTCGQCKAVYHIKARPPQRAGVCDQCGGRLVQREDDHPDSVRVRMQAYARATEPLIEFYTSRNDLVSIRADGSPEDILEQTLNCLESHLGVSGA